MLDRDVILEHPLGEELRALPQPGGIVGLKRTLDQLDDRCLQGDRCGRDSPTVKKLCFLPFISFPSPKKDQCNY
jgi:hypothetical protein